MIVLNKTVICVLTSPNIPNTDEWGWKWCIVKLWPVKVQKEDHWRSFSLCRGVLAVLMQWCLTFERSSIPLQMYLTPMSKVGRDTSQNCDPWKYKKRGVCGPFYCAEECWWSFFSDIWPSDEAQYLCILILDLNWILECVINVKAARERKYTNHSLEWRYQEIP